MRDLIAKGRFFCNHQTRRRRRHIVDNMQAKAKPEAQLGDRRSHRKEPREGRSWQFQKISIILDNNRNPWNLCIQNRDIPFWSCLSPPDTLSLPTSSFTYWRNKIPGLSKKYLRHQQTVRPQCFRCSACFRCFNFAFGPKNRPVLVQIGTKQVFQVFRPKEKLLTKRVSVRLSLRIRPHSFSAEQHLTQKRGMNDWIS